MPAGRMPATRVSAASAMQSNLSVVQTNCNARRLYSKTPNMPPRRPPLCGVESESWGWAAKGPLLHQAQAEGIAVRFAVADLNGRDDDQNEIDDAQNPQESDADEHDCQQEKKPAPAATP